MEDCSSWAAGMESIPTNQACGWVLLPGALPDCRGGVSLVSGQVDSGQGVQAEGLRELPLPPEALLAVALFSVTPSSCPASSTLPHWVVGTLPMTPTLPCVGPPLSRLGKPGCLAGEARPKLWKSLLTSNP